jgi:hypothetical protein
MEEEESWSGTSNFARTSTSDVNLAASLTAIAGILGRIQVAPINVLLEHLPLIIQSLIEEKLIEEESLKPLTFHSASDFVNSDFDKAENGRQPDLARRVARRSWITKCHATRDSIRLKIADKHRLQQEWNRDKGLGRSNPSVMKENQASRKKLTTEITALEVFLKEAKSIQLDYDLGRPRPSIYSEPSTRIQVYPSCYKSTSTGKASALAILNPMVLD